MMGSGYVTEDTIMPDGKYQGVKIKDVPVTYLLYILECNQCSKQMRAYLLSKKSDMIKQFYANRKC
jgi:hypothetical protein